MSSTTAATAMDGLPLAIELAAVRLRTLGPAELLARLDDRFRLLGRAGAADPERHRTLRATMEWSHDLLDPPAQVLWRRAAVFAADFDLAAAETVCAGAVLASPAVLEAVTALVDASLLDVVRGSAGNRFRMLETVRAFGRELLESSGEAGAVRARHRDRCAHLAAEAARRYVAPDQVAAFATEYLGQAALFRGDLPAAERLLRGAADRHRRLDPRYAAFAAADLGIAALLRGDPRRPRRPSGRAWP